jgi:hypothetical protein
MPFVRLNWNFRGTIVPTFRLSAKLWNDFSLEYRQWSGHPNRPQRYVKLNGGGGPGRNNLSLQLRPDASFERVIRFVSARRPSINSTPAAANSTDMQNTG